METVKRKNGKAQFKKSATLLNIYYFQKFCKYSVLRNFAKFTGKNLCQSLLLIQLQAGLQLY